MIVFGTGHRPEDAGYSRNAMTHMAEDQLKHSREVVTVAVCGMAGGFDLSFGLAALRSGIPLWAVRPWAGHQSRMADRALYKKLWDSADRRITVHQIEKYPGPWVYQDRNEWMVDISEEGVSFWNGKESGGTFNCIKYARACVKPVYNIFPGREGLV